MKKTTVLMAVITVVCSGAAAEAQVYVQPVNYAYPGNAYTVSQPVYAPAAYNPAVYNPAAYNPAAYNPAAYTPVTTYYAGNACGQVVPCSYSCGNPSACTPYTTTYAAASPYMQQAVYSPVTYAPAPAAYGPQACIRRGLLGQPTVYVPGQPVRNLFRFLTP